MTEPAPKADINWVHHEGPIYQYHGITEEQLRRLGLGLVPGARIRETARADGVTVRRLKSGRLNVRAKPKALIAADRQFQEFLATLNDPELHGDQETMF